MHLPIYFDGQLLRCLVVGGGPSVVPKVETLVEAGASVTVIAPQAEFKILVYSSLAKLKWEERQFQSGDCTGYDMVIVGKESGVPQLDVVKEARANCAQVNVIGEPGMSTIFFPAVLREGDLTIAVSSGSAPFMAAEFVRRMGGAVKGWSRWINLAANFRLAVMKNTKDPARREEYYHKFLEAGPLHLEPEPNEKTAIAEWLQIFRHAKPQTPAVGRKSEEPSVTKAAAAEEVEETY